MNTGPDNQDENSREPETGAETADLIALVRKHAEPYVGPAQTVGELVTGVAQLVSMPSLHDDGERAKEPRSDFAQRPRRPVQRD